MHPSTEKDNRMYGRFPERRGTFQNHVSPRRKKKYSTLGSDQFSRSARKRDERRRQSLDMLKNTTQSEQIRETLENSMVKCIDSILFEGSPEERLQTVMTKAKESGLSAEKIFSFFQYNNEEIDKNRSKKKMSKKNRITKHQFLRGLERVGDNIFVLTKEELDDLVKKFDTDKDGMISLDEFKNYCYFTIPSVAWKAERNRLESTGEMDELKARLSLCLSEGSLNQTSCGEEFCNTTKLLWRTNTSLDVRMYYCHTLEIITVQLYHHGENVEKSDFKELPCIYVRKMDCMVNQQDINEGILAAVQMSDARTETEKESIREKTELEFYSKYILDRIQLKETMQRTQVPPTKKYGTPLGKGAGQVSENGLVPFLAKLSGDEYHTVIIPKPPNLEDPPKMKRTSTNDFSETVASFDNAARHARTSRQSAQDMSSMIDMALSEALQCDENN